MHTLTRRDFLRRAAAVGATLAWVRPAVSAVPRWRERRDLFPEGVASGDPEPDSVILWTRRPFTPTERAMLTAEVALDSEFRKVVARARAPVLAESDWTCRVLAAGLKPATVYWYRFTDDRATAAASAGRSPHRTETTRARSASPSSRASSVNEGAQNAYRRMIWEDERAPADQRLGLRAAPGRLHLRGRRISGRGRAPLRPHRLRRRPDSRRTQGRQFPRADQRSPAIASSIARTSPIPTSRTRARWFPFVCIGDNHEFSWQGWQSFIKYDGKTEPAQPLRVAANQAWWEYHPVARRARPRAPGLDQFDPPAVKIAPIEHVRRGRSRRRAQQPRRASAA